MQPQPSFLSSGDLIADRRFEWARDCVAKGDLAGAADLLKQVLELVPGYASAWFVLGDVSARRGDSPAAALAFRKVLALDPDDRHGASMHLARIGMQGQDARTQAMPQAYVRTLFDGYAAVFDETLVQHLHYRAPELLMEAIKRSGRPMKFGSVLDLGCGTGLMGAAIRSCCDWLVGVDLSPGMIAKARSKGLYDRLAADDLMHFLGAEAASAAHYHLILAADVLVYVSDLAAVTQPVAQVLASDGVFAFTVETHDGEGVMLRDTLRYAHAAGELRSALDAAGLTLLSLDAASTRTEKGAPVPGLVAVAGKRAANR